MDKPDSKKIAWEKLRDEVSAAIAFAEMSNEGIGAVMRRKINAAMSAVYDELFPDDNGTSQ
jgi:hypothetical protein